MNSKQEQKVTSTEQQEEKPQNFSMVGDGSTYVMPEYIEVLAGKGDKKQPYRVRVTPFSLAYLLEYGARQSLADAHAGIKVDSKVDPKDANSTAVWTLQDVHDAILERVRKIEAGEISSRGESDPFGSEARRISMKYSKFRALNPDERDAAIERIRANALHPVHIAVMKVLNARSAAANTESVEF